MTTWARLFSNTARFELQASFFGVALLFCACLYTNVKVLEISNVETVVVFRSLSPMFVCVMEVFLLKTKIPSMWTWLSMTGIFLGAYGYCLWEQDGLSVTHYFWVGAYLASIVAEMVQTLTPQCLH